MTARKEGFIDTTIAFFPLRTNARALLAGGPALSVVRRIKQASLMHDKVLLEAGTWTANAGPSGSTSLWIPPDQAGEHRWQRPGGRRSAQDSGFHFAAGPSQSGRPLRTLIGSDSAEVAWRATLEPIRGGLPANAKWIEFESFGLTSAGKRLVQGMVQSDVDDDWLTSELHERWSRQLVSKSVAHDLVLANGLDAVVSMDKRHALVTQARVRRGEATAILGARAQEILLPDASEMSWNDLAAVRRDRGMKRLRSVLREVEGEAMEGSGSLAELDKRIHAVFNRELAKAQSASALPRSSLLATGVGFVVGELAALATSGVPGLGGLAGGASGILVGEATRRLGSARWVGTYEHIASRRAVAPSG